MKNVKDVIFTVLFWGIVSVVFSQNKGMLAGITVDVYDTPLQDVNIRLGDDSFPGSVTDDKGRYVIENIPYGNYKLIVSAVGFKTFTKVISIDKVITAFNIKLQEEIQMLEEISLSSSRISENLDEATSAVTIVSGKKLAEQISTTPEITDLLANTVPGLGVGTNTTGNRGQTLRGRNLLVMVDGIPQSTPLRNGDRSIRAIDPHVLEKIEVVKGATAIYGNGADGGFINYITKQPLHGDNDFKSITSLSAGINAVNPDKTFDGGFSQQFLGKSGNFDYIVSGSLRSTGVRRDANGVVISPTYGLGESKMYNAFAKLGLNMTKNDRMEVAVNLFSSGQKSKYITQNGAFGKNPAIGVEGTRPGVSEGTRYNVNAYIKYTRRELFANTKLDITGYLQRFKTIYSHSEGYFVGGGQSFINSDKMGTRINFNTSFGIAEGVLARLIYGIDILSDKTFQGLVDERVWVPSMYMKNNAPYVQFKTNFFGQFVLKAGARFENVTIDVDDYKTLSTVNKNGVVSPSFAVKGGRIGYNAWVFNSGLKYTGFKYFMPYLSFSQSFSVADLGRLLRAPFNKKTQTNDLMSVGDINSEAIKANNYEIGFTGAFDRFKIQGAAYISTSDLGSSYKEKNGFYEIIRAPEKVYGFEMLADAFLTNKFTTGASFSYVEGKSETSTGKSVFIATNRIAPSKFTAYLKYTPIEKMNVKLQFLHSGSRDRFSADANGKYKLGEGPVHSFSLVNLYSSYKLADNIRLKTSVENLLNSDYYTVISQWYGRDDMYAKANGIRVNLGVTISL